MTINFTVLKSSADMKRYYAPHGHDYWIEDGQQHAFFGGRLAERLGLTEFNVEAFHSLCDGLHPTTGEKLTPGRKEGRRAGYDVTVDGPKDLGVLLAIGADDRVIGALERAGRDVMAVIERDAKTRVRVERQDTDRPTGEIAYTGVLHTTARPVGDKIDFQPHFHFVVANATWDPVEHRYKALQLQPWALNGSRDARPYYTAYFNNQLAGYMQQLGYGIEKTKDSFRVVGVPESVRREFSQRTQKIEAVANQLEKQKQEFLGDPAATLSAEVKGRLGAHTRERKQPGRTWNSLLTHWNSRVTDTDRQAVLDTVANRKPRDPDRRESQALDFALSHLLERSSVVPQRKVITEALKFGIGSVTPEGLLHELGKRRDVIRRNVDGVEMVSTREVLGEEDAVLRFAQQGRGRFRPLSSRGSLALATSTEHATLSPSQQAAIHHVWTSPDRLILIRGAAGTGKTTLTKAALEGVNVPWVILAPSAEASRGVLRRDGFQNADTLAKFLVDDKLQQQARGGLIWLDEASLAGAHDLSKLIKLADSLKARVVLSGDRRQHKSVARGDALAMLEDKAGLPVAEVSDIKRQRGEYKSAVEALSKGDIAGGFRKLDALGWIKSADDAAVRLQIIGHGVSGENVTHPNPLHDLIADDYLAALKKNKSALIVSPTHAEGEELTARLRDRLKQEGRLKGEERTFERLVPLHLSEAEKGNAALLPADGLAVFHRTGGSFKPGDRVRINGDSLAGHASRFSVYQADDLRLSVGDTIRITANGKDLSGKHRLNNGAVYQVAGFTDGGNIRLNNGWIIGSDYGHFTHGYVTTSHAAQGRTVDVVLIAQSATSFPASGQEQFYVSVSRGKERATVYTDEKSALLDAIQRDDHRMLAHDLVRRPKKGLRSRLKRTIAFLRRSATLRPDDERQPEREAALER